MAYLGWTELEDHCKNVGCFDSTTVLYTSLCLLLDKTVLQ